MANSSIQEYIFENKEEIPDGIYKGIQDLLKKQHEEEQFNGIFEVKYIKIKTTMKLEKKKWECMDADDFENGMEVFDTDCDNDDDDDDNDDKTCYYIIPETHHTKLLTRLCIIHDEPISTGLIDEMRNDMLITRRMYNEWKSHGSLLYTWNHDQRQINTSHNCNDGRIKTKSTVYLIVDIQPYKK